MRSSIFFEKFFKALPTLHKQHAPGSELYDFLKFSVRTEVERLFSDPKASEAAFNPFGPLIFPYHSMGAIDSLNLFDLDELIIFSFYWINKGRYKKTLDLGANIGLHSILMDKCGYQVTAYEPDPVHFDLLKRNLSLNHANSVNPINKAISYKNDTKEFVRILNNTTGSHLAGARPDPYGEIERFPVQTESVLPLISAADLIKMDIEGHEKDVLLRTSPSDWKSTDALIEIQSADNAVAVFEHFRNTDVHIFAQKINWRRVLNEKDMPTSYREGTLFLTAGDQMPWHFN